MRVPLLHDEHGSMSDLGSEGFGDLLAAIRNSPIVLQNNIHFVVTLN
jgi:RAT1-interacting protein